MNEYDKAQAEITRGNEAQLIVNNPIYREAMVAIRADLFEKFGKTKTKDVDDREAIYNQLQSFDRFQTYLESVMNTGKIGTQTLSLLERSKKVIGL